ncbi:MAG: regulatory protein TetR [Microbacteriaceae bacterium]|nr:regulatory protein TetR [Microbacteriaceae bacterium]
MARAGLTPARVIDEAQVAVDELGVDALSLTALATRLGVRVPSLYKHIESLDAVRQAISVRAKVDFADTLARAAVGRAGGDALLAVCNAYRDWAGTHPGRYQTTLRAANPGDPADIAASERAAEVIFEVLAGYGLDEPQRVDATRLLRATLHGFVSLEAAGGYLLPVDVDRSFDRAIAALDRALAGWSGGVELPGGR